MPISGSLPRRLGCRLKGKPPHPRTCAGPWDRINVGSAWLRPLPHALLQTPPLASGKRTDTQEQAWV